MLKRQEGRRVALLTDREKKHLRKETISKKLLWKLTKKLDKRVVALIEDLNIIMGSDHLKLWRLFQGTNLTKVLRMVMELKSPQFVPIYPYKIKVRYHKGEPLYWLDMEHLSKYRTIKLLNPERALEKAFVISEEKKAILCTAMVETFIDEKRGIPILPTRPEDALTVEEVKKKLEEKLNMSMELILKKHKERMDVFTAIG